MKDKLPNPPVPIGNYVTLRTVDNLVYTSGHVPLTDNDASNFIGKIGKEISDEEGYQAAALVCDLTISTVVNNEIQIKQISPINVVGFINAVDTFEDHANILNGFTDRLAEHFPNSEPPTRSAVGVASLPKNVCVEVQAIFEIIDNN